MQRKSAHCQSINLIQCKFFNWPKLHKEVILKFMYSGHTHWIIDSFHCTILQNNLLRTSRSQPSIRTVELFSVSLCHPPSVPFAPAAMTKNHRIEMVTAISVWSEVVLNFAFTRSEVKKYIYSRTFTFFLYAFYFEFSFLKTQKETMSYLTCFLCDN